MASAANLLIGSTAGTVYIVRCDPTTRTVQLKTTISAGYKPIQLLVDVPNKCFYCLDTGMTEEEGQLLTLAPTEFGTIEMNLSIGTGGKQPTHMMNVGKNILISHPTGYSIVASPIAPKSTRRRRTSTLAPVSENTVAESLHQLYAISKAMGTEQATDNPAPAIAAIEAHIWADAQVAATELQSFVATNEPMLKFVEWQRGSGEIVVGITNKSVTLYAVSATGGQLTPRKSMSVPDIIDCEAGDDSLFVLCKDHLKQGRVKEGELSLERTIPLKADTLISLTVLNNGRRAFVLTTSSIITIDLISEDTALLDIIGTSMCLSHDNQVLFVANANADTISMYSLDGDLLGSCNIANPAGIVHMS